MGLRGGFFVRQRAFLPSRHACVRLGVIPHLHAPCHRGCNRGRASALTEPTVKPMSKLLSRRVALSAGSATALAGVAALLGAPTASAESASYFPKLKYAMIHSKVTLLQEYLHVIGLPRGADLRNGNRFTISMRASVMKYQRRYGLTDDGVVGPKTWASMIVVAPSSRFGYPTLRRGSRTNPVISVQRALVARQRRYLDCDMVFGGTTESRVKEYQRSCGLVADGVVGSRTWAALRTGR